MTMGFETSGQTLYSTARLAGLGIQTLQGGVRRGKLAVHADRGRMTSLLLEGAPVLSSSAQAVARCRHQAALYNLTTLGGARTGTKIVLMT